MNCEPMKKSLNLRQHFLKIAIAVLFLNILFVQQIVAQAPDCEECNDVIDDPIAYAQCVEENCNDAIPIDSHIWILIVGGIGMGAYAYYRYSSLDVKEAC